MNYFNSNACRLCTQESNRLRPLFTGNEDILSKLKILVPDVKVTAEDGLSTNVCERCVTQLNSSFEFKTLLEATYVSLREKQRQIQDAAFNEIFHIKDEPIQDEELELQNPAIEIYDTREAVNGCNSDLDPLSLKLEEASCNSLSNCTGALSHNGSLSQHGKEEIHCKHCNNKFATEAGLKAHSSCHKVHNDSVENVKLSFCCSYCDKSFNTERGLKIHSVKYHAKGQEYECSLCPKTFTSEIGLNKHLHSHIEERHHECSTCNERFETGIDLQQHSRIHLSSEHDDDADAAADDDDDDDDDDDEDALPNPLIECSACKKQFTSSKAMNSHRRFCSKSTDSDVKAVINQGSFECSYCKKTFNKEKAVRTHEAHCRKWQNSSNETLQTPFKSRNALQYACTLCSSSFSSLKDLINHRSVHFSTHDSQNSNLNKKLPINIHKDVHSSKEKDTNTVSPVAQESPVTSGKPVPTPKHKFRCIVCKQQFNTCKGLAVHRWRNHHEIEDTNDTQRVVKQNSTATSDKTLYQCNVCKSGFNSSRALSMHRWHRHRPELQKHRLTNYIPKMHKTNGIYMCRLCDKRFNTNKERIIHNLTYHGFKKKLIKGFPTSRSTNIKSAFTCHVCMQTFTSRTLLLKHKWHMHRATQRKANKTDHNTSVITGTSHVSSDKYFACSICDKCFTSKRLLSKHRWYEHKYKANKLANILSKTIPKKFRDVDAPKHTCPICNMSFNSIRSVAKHKWHRHRHRNQGPVNITDVYKKMTSQEHSYHLGYICQFCDRGFKSSRALNLHNWKVHGKGSSETGSVLIDDSNTQDVELYKCTLCIRKFTTYKKLAAHKLLHKHKDTKYSPQKFFTEKQSHCMDSFTKSDFGKQCSSYNCSRCSCCFDDLLTFEFHQKSCGSSGRSKKTDGSGKTWTVHSCDVCSKSFDSSSALNAHRKHHTEQQVGSDSAEVSGDKAIAHTCTICMRTFVSKHHLAIHSKVHEEKATDDETSTDILSKNPRDVQKPNLDQISGASSNILCLICSTFFRNTQEYEVHLTTVHSQKSIEKGVSLAMENYESQQRETESNSTNDSDERNYISCSVCSKMFASLNGFLMHNKKYHSRNNSSSPLENVALHTDTSKNVQQDELQGKQSSFSDLNDVCCNSCQKTFKSPHGLVIHSSKAHPLADARERARVENKEGPSDTLEEKNDNEAPMAENASHSKINVSYTRAGTHEDEGYIISKTVQEQKLQSSAEDDSSQILQQDISNVSQTQVENLDTSSFQCTICNKQFAAHRNMLIHKRMAHRQQYDTSYDNSITETELNDSNIESNKQQCNLCPRTFKHSRSLVFHKALFHKTPLHPWNDKSANAELRRGLSLNEDDDKCKETQMEPKSKISGNPPAADNKRCNMCFREFRSFHGVLVHYAMTHQKNKMEDSLHEDNEENFSNTGSNNMDTAHTPTALKLHKTEHSTNEDADSQCSVCTKTLKSAHGLLIHMKKVHPSVNIINTGKVTVHPCAPCGRTFISQRALTIHYSKFHCKNEGENAAYSEIYRCSLCSATFTSLRGLDVHRARYHGIPQSEERNQSSQNILYKCKVCFKVFSNKEILKSHLQEMHNDYSWLGEPFQQNIIDPERSTEDFEYGCVSCSKNFSTLIDLKKHSNECHKTNPDRKMLNMSDNEHEDEHEGVEPEATDISSAKQLRCPICGKASYSSVGLKIHCKRVHQTNWNDLETSQFVTIDFSDESNTGDQLLRCHVCDKLFSSSADLQVHCETAHIVADIESMYVSFNDSNAASNKDEDSLPSMDISLSKSPGMNPEGNEQESVVDESLVTHINTRGNQQESTAAGVHMNAERNWQESTAFETSGIHINSEGNQPESTTNQPSEKHRNTDGNQAESTEENQPQNYENRSEYT